MSASVTRLITAVEKQAMQAALLKLGYYRGDLDGRWGAMSVEAMKLWQEHMRMVPADGIPTYAQMVALGATVPEVIPRPSVSGSVFGNLFVNMLLPFFFKLLPKVNLPMNPVLLALGRINKATITTLVAAAATLLLLFGIDIKPDTQGIIITVVSALVTGLVTWLVPNAPPAPLKAYGLLQSSLANANPDELIEYHSAAWPEPATTAGPWTGEPAPVSEPLGSEQAIAKDTPVDANGTRTLGV